MDSREKSGEIFQNVGYSLLDEGKTIRIKAHGYSMFPCIKPGTVIFIEPINIKGNAAIGEIIAIKKNNGLIIHRLSRITVKNGITAYIARGDSNMFEDKPIELESIAGRIIGAETDKENNFQANFDINVKPIYYFNRMNVIGVVLFKRIKKAIKSLIS
jgi:hypothetical protein